MTALYTKNLLFQATEKCVLGVACKMPTDRTSYKPEKQNQSEENRREGNLVCNEIGSCNATRSRKVGRVGADSPVRSTWIAALTASLFISVEK